MARMAWELIDSNWLNSCSMSSKNSKSVLSHCYQILSEMDILFNLSITTILVRLVKAR